MLKPIFLMSAIAIALTGCSSEIDYGEVEQRGGLVYKYGGTDPYSGKVVNVPIYVGKYSGVCTQNYEKGRASGKTECFDHDKLLYEVVFEGGVKNGTEIKYDPATGKPVTILNWADDHFDGVNEEYAEGILISRKEYKNGIQHGDQKTWTRDGKTVLSDISFANGKRVTGFQDDGYSRTDYVDGLVDGVMLIYKSGENGRFVGKEIHFSRGKFNGTYKSFGYPASTDTIQQLYEVEYSNGKPLSGWYRQFSKHDGRFVQEFKLAAIPDPDGLDNDDPFPPDFVPDGRIDVFYDAVDKVTGYEIWENGERVEHDTGYGVSYDKEPASSSSPVASANNAGDCEDAWIKSFHEEYGADEPISMDMLSEWKSLCASGKSPD